MKIILNNVIPTPLKEENLSSSTIWGKLLNIDSNERYFVSSNSGKGKSTFLNYLYGLRTDFGGELTINKKSVVEYTLEEWANLRKTSIAYLPQDLQLINHLSVWDNLLLKNKLTNHYSEAEIKYFLGLFSLDKFKTRTINTLSIGQQQRVALIRTILQPMELLLLDEPFSHIDESNIKIAFSLINSICEKENAGYIITTLGYNYGVENHKTLLL